MGGVTFSLDDLLVGRAYDGGGWVGTEAWMARGVWPAGLHNPWPWPDSALELRSRVEDQLISSPRIVEVEFGAAYTGSNGRQPTLRRMASNGRVADAVLIAGVEAIAASAGSRWLWVDGAAAFVLADDGKAVGVLAPRVRDQDDDGELHLPASLPVKGERVTASHLLGGGR